MPTPEIYQKLTEAIGAHGAWKHKLRVAVHLNDGQDLTAEASNYHSCAFGRWLAGLPADVRQSPEAAATIRLHAEFHSTAGKVARKIADGDKAAALEILDGPLSAASKELTSAATRWKIAATR